jgi:FKBP-type peptidyl-prolyl cis-trans isomerase FklB
MRSPLYSPVLLVAIAAALIGHSPPLRAEAAPPTPEQAASYSLGLSFATQWREGGITPGLAQDELVRGIRDGLGGKTLTPDDRALVSAFLKTAFEAFGERNKAEAQAFLAKNGQEKGVATTASGLQYLVLTPGDASAPAATANDRVTVNYRGQFLNGTEFDSSFARGKPTTVRSSSVIPGWREALGLMHRGAKWRVFIPPELGYGASGPPTIPPNSLLVFEIEVIGIDPAVAMAPATR